MTGKIKDSAVEAVALGAVTEPSGGDVMDYLRRHPDFLTRPDVLEAISPPGRWDGDGDGVVDMQQFMLERLREEIDNLRNCAQDVIETSRVNMSTQNRTHAAVLAVLAAGDFDHLVRIIGDDLPLLLDVDVVTIGFEPSKTRGLVSPNIQRYAEDYVDSCLGAENNVLLLNEVDDDGTIFAAAAGLVRSAALGRLRPGLSMPSGMLALGSRGHAFHPGQGSELIWFLTRVVERCVNRWRDISP